MGWTGKKDRHVNAACQGRYKLAYPLPLNYDQGSKVRTLGRFRGELGVLVQNGKGESPKWPLERLEFA